MGLHGSEGEVGQDLLNDLGLLDAGDDPHWAATEAQCLAEQRVYNFQNRGAGFTLVEDPPNEVRGSRGIS